MPHTILNRRRGAERECPVCRVWFYKSPSLNQVSCSRTCRYIFFSKNPKKHHTCRHCGVVFYARDKPHSNTPHNYCSLRCRNLAYRERTGPLANGFKGVGNKNRLQRQRTQYWEWRDAVVKRDNGRCQSCGTSGVPVHAHHVKSFSSHPELRFSVDNGLTLCLSCHGLIHDRRFTESPPRPCVNCGEPTKPTRRRRCGPCYDYFRRHGVERTIK